ncbi:MAG: efflux RND transporter periplasmic adaptor subunit [Pseudobutyrivibrio sp.]|nr:efflux RND transporter periplasmic adaptor subunit [Pseudobutyrivibrio sp.]
MKKLLKPVLIIVIVAALVVGGLVTGYRYNQSKKVAQVVSLQDNAMDGYWGDNITSYGMVTSDKAQSVYIATGTEITGINVAEGDHVNAGDVVLTVKKETQDIDNKTLEVERTRQIYNAAVTKLTRLQNATPIPEYISSSADTRTRTYVNSKTYSLKDGETFGDYSSGHIVYEEYFDSTGELSSTVYYDKNGIALDEDEDATEIAELQSDISANSDKFDCATNETSEEVTVGTFYYNAETGEVIGHEGIGADGEVTERYNPPEGYKPSELKKAIEDAENDLKQKDLDLRRAEHELQDMKNTSDSGEIVAKVSGTVSKVQDKDNYNNTKPFMIITATDEYYISGSIGEFYLDSVNVGDVVSISSWETGNSAEATITSISDTPNTDNNNFYSGNGNSNSSNYEFKASFDKSSGIELDSAVDISITPSNQETGGLYIPSYFIRKDNSGSYVMRMDESSHLEKVYVKVGKTLWGEMIEIKDGLTMDDYLAFPYGNGAISGIKCEITDSLSDY